MKEKKILLLENSNFFGRAIKQQLETHLGLQVIWYRTYTELRELKIDLSKIELSLIDYDLPDSKNGETLNICSQNNIPIILLTTEINHNIQEKIWSYKVIDYILKGTSHSIESIIDIINRFFTNHNKEILVVDNSEESRNHLKSILHIHRYSIIEAESEEEALNILDKNSNIHMVVTDYQPPSLDGLSLTNKIRKKFPVDRLAIIGISAQGNHSLKIQFIKNGANDFINKPFVSELLFCRVIQNLKIVEYFHELKDMALFDQLTQLNNRHYLRETGNVFFENSKRNGCFLIAAMIDIDDFKKINDNFGHETGDIVLKHIATILKNSVRKSDIICRYGGEEFIVIANNLNPKNALTFFDNLRLKIKENSIIIKSKKINLTVSIGVCLEKLGSLDEMINNADVKMYQAKTSGKDKVCL